MRGARRLKKFRFSRNANTGHAGLVTRLLPFRSLSWQLSGQHVGRMKFLPSRRFLKPCLWGIVGIFLVLQLFRPTREVSAAAAGHDLIAMHWPPPAVREVLERACYDCHSNQTKYPWYASVQPVAWWLDRHVDEGREHVNFSHFGGLSARRAAQMLEACSDAVAEKEMPLWSYTLGHPEARLSDQQRDALVEWMVALAETYREKMAE